MSIPLSFLRSSSSLLGTMSLGDSIAHHLDHSEINTLLDCFCTTSSPAIHSTDPSRPPLTHDRLRSFVSTFVLPHSVSREPFRPNDRVMIVLPTGPENAVALMSIATYHTCAPINASCTAAELKEDAQRLAAKAVVTTRDAVERLELETLRKELGCDVILVDARPTGPAGLFDMTILGTPATSPPQHPSRPHGLDNQSLVLHTSGTSGKKKVVPYTLRSLIIGAMAVVQSWDLRTDDVNMNMMPLFHVGGIVRNLWAPMLSGGSAIMCTGFDAIAFWPLAMQLKATWYYAAPTIHHAILSAQPESVVPARDLKIRMICNAAGGLLPSLAVELRERFAGAVVLPSYGMTECMPIASPPTSYQLERPGCSGIACGPYLSIRDPFNLERELSTGQTGAVSVRGLPTFQGYEVSPDINVPLDTSAFSSEGWFDSGDMGYMDVDGYLYITGRSKEIINKGGEVISPFEIEEAIMTAAKDFVKTTLCFALEHDVLQESIGVVIVPVPDRPRIGLAQLQDLLKDHLHPSKWPFAIVYMNDLPKNSAGKPLRIKLNTRLGIGCLTDSVPAIQRHFEAEVPPPTAALSDPISCSRIEVDFVTLQQIILSTSGVLDVTLRTRSDGSAEAFVSINPDTAGGLTSSSLKDTISSSMPGYMVPEPIYVFSHPLIRYSDGNIDFAQMEEEILKQNTAAMSKEALLVRDIIADLLNIEPGKITAVSDFFLMGGNSLLLGKLSHRIRRESGVSVAVSDVFTNSTVGGIGELLASDMAMKNPAKDGNRSPLYSSTSTAVSSLVTLNGAAPQLDFKAREGDKPRGPNHPLCLVVQAIPILFFYSLKAALTWTMLLYIMSYLVTAVSDDGFWVRMMAFLVSIVGARLSIRIVAPITAILFKWLVIGKYRHGVYPMWSNYYLRWWIVNQSIRSAGRGIFGFHPSLQVLYLRLLGAKVGKNVRIDSNAKLGEFDLLTLGDNCRIDSALVRGFCVERDGYFKLDSVVIGKNAVINTYTQISPGAVILDNSVYGPHASSHEPPAAKSQAACNRTFRLEPHWLLKLFVAWPIALLVLFASYVPWFAILWLMVKKTRLFTDHVNALEAVIYWFANPQRVQYHIIARMVRATVTPLIQLVLGIAVKRVFGLNREESSMDFTQIVLLRKYLTATLLSKGKMKSVFSLLGSHYEIVSIVYRAMGAKIGRRVYWPGSGVYCPDPELLEIGNDVVFGSRSELFTTDTLGSGKIIIGDGAMIADRVVLLPGTKVGRQTVMGSGALGKRDTTYADGSVWMGSNNGEAMCFNKGSKESLTSDTTTPFGRAFYQRKADYFVYPYPFIALYHFFTACLSAAFWSLSPVAAAQLLRQFHIHLHRYHFFASRWYRLGILFGLIASFFIIVLQIQAMIALLWVVVTKWIVIGKRKAGRYDWDKSSYCQRWQLHLALSRPLYKGFGSGGILAPITGSTYIVWFFRALGAKIGRNVCLFAGGKVGLLTEPDLVELGDYVSLDDCSVVAHINSRGNFSLNALKLGEGCAMRTGSRLLSGASMEDSSMLCEHTLLTSGEVAESGGVYVGWPGKLLEPPFDFRSAVSTVAELSPTPTPTHTTFEIPMLSHGNRSSRKHTRLMPSWVN